MVAAGPRVSVVIPCHNSLRWLPITLESVLQQTFTDFEVILVDDGGDDDLASWAADVGDPRVRVLRQDNAGVSAARNAGAAAGHGELIALLDSDDVWEPRALEALVEAFDAAVSAAGAGDAPVGLAYGWYDVVDAAGVSTGRVETSRWEGDVWDRVVTANVNAIGATVVAAEAFRSVGGFVDNRDRFEVDVEDWEFWIRLSVAHRFALAPELVLHVRRHDSNSTGAGATQVLERAYRALFDRVFDPANMPPRDPAVVDGLRAAAVSHAEVILAWQSLNDDHDPDRARSYLRSAVRHRPDLRRDPDYWRIRAALGATRMLGRSGLDAVRRASQAVRRPLSRRRTGGQT